MIKKCTKCENGEVNFSMSELMLVDGTDPQQAEIEGICFECGTHYTFRFKEYEYQITDYDDFMEEKEVEVIKI